MLRGNWCVVQVVVHSGLDMFGSNKRLVILLKTSLGFDIMYVVVSAAEVGSIRMVVPAKGHVEKGDPLGHFAYGGSSVVTLFPAGRVQFDEDLVRRSLQSVETLVKTGTSLGLSLLDH
jgi:phosphatidylserine decarboxylase